MLTLRIGPVGTKKVFAKRRNFLEGKALIAMPGMPDPLFEGSVHLTCATTTAQGAMGLIINKPIDGLTSANWWTSSASA